MKEEQWIPLKVKLPPANIEVEWYDAMFDNNMIFAMENPAQYDPDFTHWKPKTARPEEYQLIYGDGKHKAPPRFYRERDFIRENKVKWMYKIERSKKILKGNFADGAKYMLKLIGEELKKL